MYGSTAYGICFNDSSCDVSIEFDSATSNKNKTSNQIISCVTDLIRNEMSDTFHLKTTTTTTNNNQNSNKNNKNYAKTNSSNSQNQSPNKYTVESIESKIVFNFTNGLFPTAYKTATLLRGYFELDERAKILAFCFRYIAKVRVLVITSYQ